MHVDCRLYGCRFGATWTLSIESSQWSCEVGITISCTNREGPELVSEKASSKALQWPTVLHPEGQERGAEQTGLKRGTRRDSSLSLLQTPCTGSALSCLRCTTLNERQAPLSLLKAVALGTWAALPFLTIFWKWQLSKNHCILHLPVALSPALLGLPETFGARQNCWVAGRHLGCYSLFCDI